MGGKIISEIVSENNHPPANQYLRRESSPGWSLRAIGEFSAKEAEPANGQFPKPNAPAAAD